ncbi:hypothetical protein BAZOLSSOX_691, partial [uncultured Gammaproteobacteria bacterium]
YFYRVKSRDAAGRLTGHIVGNGLSTEQEYSPASGHLYTIKSNFNSTNQIRNLEYEYDLMDNVTQRQNHISGLSEGFTYDALDRLTQSSTTGKIDDVDYSYKVDYKYDINGNILNKSDVGDYSYNAASGVRPHTPNSITGIKTNTSTNTNNQDRTYTYDANGSMTKNNDKTIQWTSFNKPKSFTKGKDSTTFTYGPDRSRYQKVQTRSSDNTTITTQYFGKIYEKIKQNTNTEHKHFIYADGQLIAIHIKTDTTSAAGTSATSNTPATPIPDKTRYLHYDNLGSIDTITDGQGNIVERMAYTAFGQRRKGDWRASDPLLPIIPALTNRGFTGHEHIDEMGFIHMNGRVYDPQIGRFLSADPHIQDPYNTQSYNRYSYVINNPLKYTDPTGNFFGIILGFISAVATQAVISAIGAQLLLAQIVIAYAVTYSVTYIATGSGKAAQGAGLAAGLFMGIGGLRGGKMGIDGKMHYNPGWESGSMKTLAAHGLAGGIVQDRMGGSFGAGFLAGSLGSYFGSSGKSGNTNEMIVNTAREAVIGGTISVVGGGKFSNGAQTGAFRYLFNESMHQQGTPISKVTKALTPDSIAVPGFEGKAGIVSLSVNPGTLELNANNPYNNNDVFSRDASATFLGFGGSVTQRTYDLGETWMTTYDFASDFGADKSGGIIYKTGVGFKGLGLNWKYDIDINIVDMFLGKPAY